MRRLTSALAGLVVAAALAAPAQAAAERVTVTGEVIDSWCYITEIMYPLGTAHHQCAIWCAAGGIPVGLLGEDETVYIVLKVERDTTSIASPAVMNIQSHQVTVEGDLFRRDGVNYLLIDQVVDDQGVVNQTHQDYGIQPWGE